MKVPIRQVAYIKPTKITIRESELVDGVENLPY